MIRLSVAVAAASADLTVSTAAPVSTAEARGRVVEVWLAAVAVDEVMEVAADKWIRTAEGLRCKFRCILFYFYNRFFWARRPDEYERSGSAAFNRYDFPPLGSSGNDMMMSR